MPSKVWELVERHMLIKVSNVLKAFLMMIEMNPMMS